MMQINLLPQEQWQSLKREPLQKYKDYFSVVEDNLEGIPIATASLMHGMASKADAMRAAESRALDTNQVMIFSYSAGVGVSDLAPLIVQAIDYWESYARYHLEFHASEECDDHKVPHIDLYDRDYWEALQLVCYAILLGHPELLGRIMDLLVYENDDQDALLEDLVAPYLPGRPGSAVYTRQLPYRKTKKIFAAKPDKRAELMSQYLDEWYEASRREPYYDRHKSSYFPGYWSLEAAAITYILDIDDSSYRDKKFYPKDLVDYARAHGQRPPQDGAPSENIVRLRCEAGQPCPREGWWSTPAKDGSRQHFKQGDLMPDMKSDYGQTIWQWDIRQ